MGTGGASRRGWCSRCGLGPLAIVITLALGLVLAGVVGALSLRGERHLRSRMVTLAFAQAGFVVILGRNPGQTTGGDEGLPLPTKQGAVDLIGVV
ncbi:hypothetical protein [Humibacter ginsenosidimutans]|uniref:hypothetical protein n=1 Tax=Humibacter ginsenosidimutans TaxID=2599293 RepID=UPI001FEFB544|nr:hypothetical protein [Humibacter ginsenosidimutans]